jgi:hypothetical protein
MGRFRTDRNTDRDERNARAPSRGASPKSPSETHPPAPGAPVRPAPGPPPKDDGRTTESPRPSSGRHADDRPDSVAGHDIYEHHGTKYRLHPPQADVLRAVGAFRTVRATDALEGVYRGDERAFERDLRHLQGQNLVTVSKFRGRPNERFLSLTPEAKRLADARLKRVSNQRIYSGLAKLQELDHDAGLYKMYLKAIEGIEKDGGKPTRVVLDYELKKTLNRELDAAKKLPKDDELRELQRLADQHDLRVVDGKIPVPDVRIEYEKSDGEHAHLDLEYVTGNYRAGAIAEKARAGFTLYAPAGFDRSSGGAAGRRVRDEYPSLAAEIISL